MEAGQDVLCRNLISRCSSLSNQYPNVRKALNDQVENSAHISSKPDKICLIDAWGISCQYQSKQESVKDGIQDTVNGFPSIVIEQSEITDY